MSYRFLVVLARRDEVIRDLLKKHLPVVMELSVLVVDLQASTMICMQLPPEEYFELISQMWDTMEPVFRKYYVTHGKYKVEFTELGDTINQAKAARLSDFAQGGTL